MAWRTLEHGGCELEDECLLASGQNNHAESRASSVRLALGCGAKVCLSQKKGAQWDVVTGGCMWCSHRSLDNIDGRRSQGQ